MERKLVIYRRAKYGLGEIGDLTDVRVGDVVQFWDDSQNAFRSIIKVNVKAGMARLAPVVYEQYTLVPSRSIRFDDIITLQRILDDDHVPTVMDMFHTSSAHEFATPDHADAEQPEVIHEEPAKRKRKVLPKRSVIKKKPK